MPLRSTRALEESAAPRWRRQRLPRALRASGPSEPARRQHQRALRPVWLASGRRCAGSRQRKPVLAPPQQRRRFRPAQRNALPTRRRATCSNSSQRRETGHATAKRALVSPSLHGTGRSLKHALRFERVCPCPKRRYTRRGHTAITGQPFWTRKGAPRVHALLSMRWKRRIGRYESPTSCRRMRGKRCTRWQASSNKPPP